MEVLFFKALIDSNISHGECVLIHNTYHSTIKIKPIYVKSSTDTELNKEINKEDAKVEVGDHVRISKYFILFYQKHFSERLHFKLIWRSFCN